MCLRPIPGEDFGQVHAVHSFAATKTNSYEVSTDHLELRTVVFHSRLDRQPHVWVRGVSRMALRQRTAHQLLRLMGRKSMKRWKAVTVGMSLLIIHDSLELALTLFPFTPPPDSIGGCEWFCDEPTGNLIGQTAGSVVASGLSVAAGLWTDDGAERKE